MEEIALELTLIISGYNCLICCVLLVRINWSVSQLVLWDTVLVYCFRSFYLLILLWFPYFVDQTPKVYPYDNLRVELGGEP